jgi:hypothetical protein
MKKFFITAAIAIAGLGAWWLFGSGSLYILPKTALAPNSAEVRSGVVAGISTSTPIMDTVNGILSQIGQAFNDATSSAADALTNIETGAAGAAKNAIDNTFEGAVGQGENLLGIATGTTPDGGTATYNITAANSLYQNNGGAISVLVGPVVKVGQSISFVVDESLFSGQNAQTIDVYANWQDGTEENQTLSASGGNDLLTHAFSTAGTYKPLFTFVFASSTIQYKMIIVVQP